MSLQASRNLILVCHYLTIQLPTGCPSGWVLCKQSLWLPQTTALGPARGGSKAKCPWGTLQQIRQVPS